VNSSFEIFYRVCHTPNFDQLKLLVVFQAVETFFCSSFKRREIPSSQTKFQHRGILKYLILATKMDSFKCFIILFLLSLLFIIFLVFLISLYFILCLFYYLFHFYLFYFFIFVFIYYLIFKFCFNCLRVLCSYPFVHMSHCY